MSGVVAAAARSRLAFALAAAMPAAVAPSAAGLAVLATATPAAAEQPPRRALVLVIAPGPAAVDPEAVRDAVARELAVDVVELPAVSAAGTLHLRFVDEDTVEMTFERAGGERSVERSLQLPPEPERRVEAIALLAGNLARDEAGELVASLRAATEQAAATQAQAEQEAAAAAKRAAERAEAARIVTARGAANRAAATRPPAVLLAPATSAGTGAAAGARRIAGEVHRAVDRALASEDRSAPLTFQAGLVPRVSLYPRATDHRFHAVLTGAYGRQRGVAGAALSLGTQNTTGVVRGTSLAAIAQLTGTATQGFAGAGLGQLGRGPLRGSEVAGLLNVREGVVEGVQLAGLGNHATGVVGAQLSGLFNRAHGDLLGLQVGALNLLDGELVGLQLGGLVNVNRGPAAGLLLTGLGNAVHAELDGVAVGSLFNTARDLRGAQLALVNMARDVRGAQVGLVNVARDVRGTQVGLVNVSRELHGAPLGLVNITRGGPRVVVWHERALEKAPQNLVAGIDVAAKFVAGPVYTQLGLGGDVQQRTWDVTAGLGLHLELGPIFFEVDALYRGDWDVRPSNENDAQGMHYRGKVGRDLLGDKLALFLGGGLRQVVARDLALSHLPTAFAGLEAR